jgi:hypothetical protein
MTDTVPLVPLSNPPLRKERRQRKTETEARAALIAAKEKLMLYRAQHSGDYIGGVEYTSLMRMINRALE